MCRALGRPVRAEPMQQAGRIDQAAWDALPPVSGEPVIVSVEQNKKATDYLAGNWASAIG